MLNKPASTDAGFPFSFENGMEELLKIKDIRAEAYCVSSDTQLTGWSTGDMESLINMVKTHVSVTCEANKTERIAYVGLDYPLMAGTYGGVVYSKGILDVIKRTNNPSVSICGQEIKRFKANGKEGLLPSWALACSNAGVQLGTDLGEPLTLKFLDISDVQSPLNDWDALDPVDLRRALDGSLLYVEPFNGSHRIVRGFTSYMQEDNLAKTDINVWEIRNYLQRRLRDSVEKRFGGRGIGITRPGVRFVAPANIASIREHVTTLLEEDRADGNIVDSQDASGNFINAYNSLAVKISGDVCTVKVQVFPKTGLNFILIDTAFQLPTISA